MTIEVSFYNIKGYKMNHDCDHGHCVEITISHGGPDCSIFLYVDTKEEGENLIAHLKESVRDVQLLDC